MKNIKKIVGCVMAVAAMAISREYPIAYSGE